MLKKFGPNLSWESPLIFHLFPAFPTSLGNFNRHKGTKQENLDLGIKSRTELKEEDELIGNRAVYCLNLNKNEDYLKKKL